MTRLALAAVLLASTAACAGAPAPPPVVVTLPPAPAEPAPDSSAGAAASPAPSAKPKADEASPDARAASIAAELAQLDSAMLAGGSLLDAAAARGAGVGSGGAAGLHLGGGGGAVKPGGGGGLANLGAPNAPSVPMATVAIGGAAVSGGSVANAAAVVAGMAAGFRRCLNKALQEQPPGVTDGASIHVTARIGPNGEVLSVSPSRVRGVSGKGSGCIMARVAAAQFAPPDGGSATVEIPVSVRVVP